MAGLARIPPAAACELPHLFRTLFGCYVSPAAPASLGHCRLAGLGHGGTQTSNAGSELSDGLR